MSSGVVPSGNKFLFGQKFVEESRNGVYPLSLPTLSFACSPVPSVFDFSTEYVVDVVRNEVLACSPIVSCREEY